MNKEEKLKSIMDEWKGFTDGVRVLFLIWRNKEGAKVDRNLKIRKLVSSDEEEFEKCLEQLLDLKERYAELPLRIYSTVNKRNLDKAIRKLKELQLENDYQDKKQFYGFYKDIKNRWISSLMRNSSRFETQFIIDIDNKSEEYLARIKSEVLAHTTLIKEYKTKNGYHLIVRPFNPNLIKSYSKDGHIYEDVSLKKDDLVLLDY
jgi:hypothetical protein